MEVIIQSNPQTATHVAAKIIARQIRNHPSTVLGLATGSTPLMLYQTLIEMNLDWSEVKTFNLDEYIGLPFEHPQSYYHFMWENLFGHINIRKQNVHIPDGNAKDISKICQHYEQLIKAAGGIDMQLLGIGTNGHMGFNEPTSSLASRTRIKTLTQQTCHDNARFFGNENDVPRHVITMGIGTIMEAREVLMLAFGTNKAQAVVNAVEGPVSAMNPASILQMHPVAKVCLDESAASFLEKSDYYRWVYANKPAWQEI